MTRNRFVTTCLALGATLLLGACGETAATYGRDDPTIAARPGERFAIELDSNPSIGDDWRLIGRPDPDVVAFRGESSTSESDEPGSGGTVVFRFEALAAGSTRVELFDCYRCGGDERPSSENEPLSERLVFEIVVR